MEQAWPHSNTPGLFHAQPLPQNADEYSHSPRPNILKKPASPCTRHKTATHINMRRWKCGRTKKTTISILPPSIQASCTSFQKKDRDWKKTCSRESPFSQTRITGFVDIILPFRRREKSPVPLCPGNGTVIPPGDDRIDFPSSYRETGPAAQQPRFRTTRKRPLPFLLPPLLRPFLHVP